MYTLSLYQYHFSTSFWLNYCLSLQEWPKYNMPEWRNNDYTTLQETAETHPPRHADLFVYMVWSLPQTHLDMLTCSYTWCGRCYRPRHADLFVYIARTLPQT